MSANVNLWIEVVPSSEAKTTALRKAFAAFLEDESLAGELELSGRRQAGKTRLCAESDFPIGISSAHEWIPAAKERFSTRMKAIDPGCKVTFSAEYDE